APPFQGGPAPGPLHLGLEGGAGRAGPPVRSRGGDPPVPAGERPGGGGGGGGRGGRGSTTQATGPDLDVGGRGGLGGGPGRGVGGPGPRGLLFPPEVVVPDLVGRSLEAAQTRASA